MIQTDYGFNKFQSSDEMYTTTMNGLNDNVDTEVGLFDQLNTTIANLQSENAELLDQIPSYTPTPATSLNIQDSSNLPIKDFSLLGNATQDTNILTYKCAGTESGDYYFVYSSTNYQFTMPTISAGDILTFNTIEEKLYKGTTKITTTTASTGTLITLSNTPSPDYPVNVNVATGDNTLYFTGKNLVWTTWATDAIVRIAYPTDQITIETKDNRTCLKYSSAVGFVDYNTRYLYKPQAGFKENTQYTFSGWVYKEGNDKFLTLSYTDGTSTNISVGNGNTSKWVYFTATSTAGKTLKYIIPAFFNGYTWLDLNTFQCEVGTTATTYEPYTSQTQLISLGDIELVKIGNYIDQPFKAQVGLKFYDSLPDSIKANLTLGKWYLYKAIGKVTLNGSETWAVSGKVYYTEITTKRKSYVSEQGYLISNMFKNTTASQSSNVAVGEMFEFYNTTYGNKNVGFNYDDAVSGTDSFKTWLNTHNITLYYILATPTTTEITDQTLLGQLNNILQMSTNKNTTNIFTLVASGNENGELKVEYRVDLQTKLDNLQTAILSL